MADLSHPGDKHMISFPETSVLTAVSRQEEYTDFIWKDLISQLGRSGPSTTGSEGSTELGVLVSSDPVEKMLKKDGGWTIFVVNRGSTMVSSLPLPELQSPSDTTSGVAQLIKAARADTATEASVFEEIKGSDIVLPLSVDGKSYRITGPVRATEAGCEILISKWAAEPALTQITRRHADKNELLVEPANRLALTNDLFAKPGNLRDAFQQTLINANDRSKQRSSNEVFRQRQSAVQNKVRSYLEDTFEAASQAVDREERAPSGAELAAYIQRLGVPSRALKEGSSLQVPSMYEIEPLEQPISPSRS